MPWRNRGRSIIEAAHGAEKVMEEMEREKDDLLCYVNLFGYNPKFGIDGKAIASVTYKPQPYNSMCPLYEM